MAHNLPNFFFESRYFVLEPDTDVLADLQFLLDPQAESVGRDVRDGCWSTDAH